MMMPGLAPIPGVLRLCGAACILCVRTKERRTPDGM